ncbi:MAG TPA: phage holin family protein [Polyangia bacterium]|jgi:cytochrome c oxidase subunit IV|nr:phage holin family protein [Polyangia bacterium]HWE31201.1 phage holin family protein [Polyangia bacterium]
MREDSDPQVMDTSDLVKELAADSSLLVKRQLELAKLEVASDLRKRVSIVEAFGVCGLMAYGAVMLLLVAAASAISIAIGYGLWLGALIVAAILLAPTVVIGALGYRKMEETPKLLQRTKKELDKEIELARMLAPAQTH